MESFWNSVIWGLNPMWSGKFPERDWDGQSFPLLPEDAKMAGGDIAGGLFFVPWQVYP